MTDRELLERAAKAAGIEISWSEQGVFRTPVAYIGHTDYEWDPLLDDGDALRLAVKLQLMINCSGASVHVFDGQRDTIEQSRGQGAESATRRAIVRAAAEMAK